MNSSTAEAHDICEGSSEEIEHHQLTITSLSGKPLLGEKFNEIGSETKFTHKVYQISNSFFSNVKLIFVLGNI